MTGRGVSERESPASQEMVDGGRDEISCQESCRGVYASDNTGTRSYLDRDEENVGLGD